MRLKGPRSQNDEFCKVIRPNDLQKKMSESDGYRRRGEGGGCLEQGGGGPGLGACIGAASSLHAMGVLFTTHLRRVIYAGNKKGIR